MKGFLILIFFIMSILFGVMMTRNTTYTDTHTDIIRPPSRTIELQGTNQVRYFSDTAHYSIDLPKDFISDSLRQVKEITFSASSSYIELDMFEMPFDSEQGKTASQEEFTNTLLKKFKGNVPDRPNGSTVYESSGSKIRLGDNSLVVYSLVQNFIDTINGEKYSFYIREYVTSYKGIMYIVECRSKVPIPLSIIPELDRIVSTIHFK